MNTHYIIDENEEIVFRGTQDECEFHFLIELNESYKVVSVEDYHWFDTKNKI